MKNSAAEIVKSYMEKYILINMLKTKQNRYEDIVLARSTLSVAFHILQEMNFLIRSNNANDLCSIKKFLNDQLTVIHNQLRQRQTILDYFTQTKLPPDFGRCINDTWFQLGHFERESYKTINTILSAVRSR